MKNERQRMILEIIEEYEIGTQEALIARLAERGLDVTQTTVSRDIRQLKLVKGPTGRGTYKYVSPIKKEDTVLPGHNSVFTEAVISIEAAQNIVVIKTHTGMASALAVCIDGLAVKQIVGAVAGDDTILAVAKDNADAMTVAAFLKQTFID